MSGISPITSISSASCNSPKRLNPEEVQIPFPNPNNPTSQQHSSQFAKEDSSSSSANHPSNQKSCQQIDGQAFLCPHNIQIACFCCSQHQQRDENPATKGFEKLLRDCSLKAQVLEGSLGDFKEEIKKLQKRVKETTEPLKKTVQNWFEANVEVLVAIRNDILLYLDQTQQKLFSKERFTPGITEMEKQIMMLKGEFFNFEGLYTAFTKEGSQLEIQKKMIIIQKLSNSLINPDVNDLKRKLSEIVLIKDQAVKNIKIPAFVDERLYEAADMDASTMISSLCSRL